MANIHIQYFAQLRELAGKNQESLAIEAGLPAASLYLDLAERYHFPLQLKDIRVAVNSEFVEAYRSLQDGDQVVFIPPVAGG